MFELDFHDSEVRASLVDAGTLRIDFAAAHGRLVAGGAVGFVPGVVLAMPAASPGGDVSACLGRVVDGTLRLDGRAIAPVVAPSQFEGAVTLTLRFANGAVLAATGHAVAISLPEDAAARFVEDFSC